MVIESANVLQTNRQAFPTLSDQNGVDADDDETNVDLEILTPKLTELTCRELRRIGRSMRVPEVWKLRKKQLIGGILLALNRNPRVARQSLSSDTEIAEQCRLSGTPFGPLAKQRLGLKEYRAAGLVCHLKQVADQFEKSTDAVYADMRQRQECAADNLEYPDRGFSTRSDCPDGYVQLVNTKDPQLSAGRCCSRIQKGLSIWDPERFTELCAGCDSLDEDTRKVLTLQAEGGKDEIDDFNSELAKVENNSPKQLKFLVEVMRNMQEQTILKMGSKFDDMMGVLVDTECEKDDVTKKPGWLSSAQKSWAWWAAKGIAQIAWMLLKAVGKFTAYIGGKLVTATTMGMQVSMFIFSNPKNSKYFLAGAKLVKNRLCSFLGDQLDERGFLYYIESLLKRSGVPSGLPMSVNPKAIAQWPGSKQSFINDNQLSVADTLEQADLERSDQATRDNSGWWSVFTQSVTRETSKAKMFAADTLGYARDVDVTTEVSAVALDALDLKVKGTKLVKSGVRSASAFLAGAVGLGAGVATGGVLPAVAVGSASFIADVMIDIGLDAIQKGAEISIYTSRVLKSFSLVADILSLDQCIAQVEFLPTKYPRTHAKIRSIIAIQQAFAIKLIGGDLEQIADELDKVVKEQEQSDDAK